MVIASVMDKICWPSPSKHVVGGKNGLIDLYNQTYI